MQKLEKKYKKFSWGSSDAPIMKGVVLWSPLFDRNLYPISSLALNFITYNDTLVSLTLLLSVLITIIFCQLWWVVIQSNYSDYRF